MSRSRSFEDVVESVESGRPLGEACLHRRDRRGDVPGPDRPLRRGCTSARPAQGQLVQLSRRGTGEGVQRSGDGSQAGAAVVARPACSRSIFVTATAALTSSICSFSRALNQRCTPGSSRGSPPPLPRPERRPRTRHAQYGTVVGEPRPARTSATASAATRPPRDPPPERAVAQYRGHLPRRAVERAVPRRPDLAPGRGRGVPRQPPRQVVLVGCSAASSAPRRSRRRCRPGSGRPCGRPSCGRAVGCQGELQDARRRGDPHLHAGDGSWTRCGCARRSPPRTRGCRAGSAYPSASCGANRS